MSTSGSLISPAVVTEDIVPKLVAGAGGSSGEGGDAKEAPVAKERCVGRSKTISWGSASVIGRRKEMEDAVAVVPGFMCHSCESFGGCRAPGSRTSLEIAPLHFFGVYDGHGGSQVATFCAERMHEAVAAEWTRGSGEEGWLRKWEEAFSKGFVTVDSQVKAEAVAPDTVGSTAVIVVVSGCQIVVSNCGDSRAVLCRGKVTIPLTVDHKPDREDELARIEEKGGRVMNWNGARVLGVLAMSRAIGDHYFRPWVIPLPEVTFTTRTLEDECLIVASDGLWDVISNDEVGQIACQMLRRYRRVPLADDRSAIPAQTVAEHLVELAYNKNGCDNISVIVVDLKGKRKPGRGRQ